MDFLEFDPDTPGRTKQRTFDLGAVQDLMFSAADDGGIVGVIDSMNPDNASDKKLLKELGLCGTVCKKQSFSTSP